jgi:hypothetical protein
MPASPISPVGANALANLVTALAQANNASSGGQTGSAGSAPARGGSANANVNDWGVYRIGPAKESPEGVHGSRAAILARTSGSYVGLGRSSETVETLVARGDWKIEEVSRASSYEEAHQQYQALYSQAKPSQFWGPFIRINDNLINKYNNPGPVGGPR